MFKENVLLFVAGECFTYADNKDNIILPEFSRVIKGLICGFFIMVTGAFALLEYVVCFLEFMLVDSVGIILFPLSIWEGSKFLAEKFIGAIVGFFMKLLFCNISIFLLLYGFISLFYIISAKQKLEGQEGAQAVAQGFTGQPDQIIFSSLSACFSTSSASLPRVSLNLCLQAPLPSLRTRIFNVHLP